MLNEKIALHLPGPTPVPPQVAAAMTMPMVNHRGATFARLYAEVAAGLQQVFRTREQVYVLPGSGSGGWEAAMVNFVPAGATVLNVVIGDFGERWAKANAALGFKVERLDCPAGTAAAPAGVAARLAADTNKEIKAVCFQHNETSTGVFNPVREIAAEVARHGALVMVDAVSGLGALPLEMDAWGLDVVLTGAQKALMCPPGLTIIAASQKAWAQANAANTPKFYFDLKAYKAGFEKSSTPYTPALSLYYGLQAALKLIEQEGLEQVFARHRLMGQMCRAGVKAMGLELLCADERFASDAVTAVKIPAGLEGGNVRKTALGTFGVILAAGQGKLQDQIFRIGHLGYVTPNDVILALAAVENTLAHLGHPVHLGRAVAGAQAVWLDRLRAQ